MKIIGLMLTWNNIEFFRFAIKQALEFCDELILVEGCHSLQYPQRSDDGTLAFIQTIRKQPKLRIMDFARGKRYDYIQKDIRQEYPKQSRYYKPGNWVFHWDDDFFFMNEGLQKLRDMMRRCKEDSLALLGRRFSHNFRFNVLMRMQPYCYRIIDGLKLKGVSIPCYNSMQIYTVSYLDNIIAFHYSYVKRLARMKTRFVMSAEKGTPNAMDKFNIWENIKWNKDKDILNNDNIKKVMAKGKLNIYEGPHPEVLNNHPWRYINDVRKVK